MDRILILLLFSTLPGIETILTEIFGFPITKILVFALFPLIVSDVSRVKIPKRIIAIQFLLLAGGLFKMIHFEGEDHRYDTLILLIWITMVSFVKPSNSIKRFKLVSVLCYTTLIFLIVDGINLLQRDLTSLFDRNDIVLYEGLETFDSYLIFAQMSLLTAGLAFVLIRSKMYIRIGYIILALSSVLVFFSTSRGGLIALVFLFIINFNLFDKKLKYSVLIFSGILIFSNSTLVDALNTGFEGIGTDEDHSSHRRLMALNIGIEGFYKSPFLGQGWDFVRNNTSIPPHSMPIQLLAELGLLGLCIELFLHIGVYSFLKNKSTLTGIHHVYLTFVFWSNYENIGWVYGHRILAFILALGIIFVKRNANCSNVRLPEYQA